MRLSKTAVEGGRRGPDPFPPAFWSRIRSCHATRVALWQQTLNRSRRCRNGRRRGCRISDPRSIGRRSRRRQAGSRSEHWLTRTGRAEPRRPPSRRERRRRLRPGEVHAKPAPAAGLRRRSGNSPGSGRRRYRWCRRLSTWPSSRQRAAAAKRGDRRVKHPESAPVSAWRRPGLWRRRISKKGKPRS